MVHRSVPQDLFWEQGEFIQGGEYQSIAIQPDQLFSLPLCQSFCSSCRLDLGSQRELQDPLVSWERNGFGTQGAPRGVVQIRDNSRMTMIRILAIRMPIGFSL